MCVPVIFWRILLSLRCWGSWGESLSLLEEVTQVPEGYKTTADGKQLPLCCSNDSSGKCQSCRDAGPHLVQKKTLEFIPAPRTSQGSAPPALPQTVFHPFPAQAVATGLFQGRKVLWTENQRMERGWSRDLPTAILPATSGKVWGGAPQVQPQSEGDNGVRIQPGTLHTWQCSLENACCFPSFLSVPISRFQPLPVAGKGCEHSGRVWVTGSGRWSSVGAPASPWLLRGESQGSATLSRARTHLELLVPGEGHSQGWRHIPQALGGTTNPPSMIPAPGQSSRRTWEVLQGMHTDAP